MNVRARTTMSQLHPEFWCYPSFFLLSPTRPSGDPPSEKGLRLRFLNIRARTTKCIDAAVIETAQVTGTLAEQPKN